ncbi:ankyrin repeat and SAM domain-containing protein 3-like [Physella acuta]|uniref:ankyrin repeat and SAM domain-containing protein 3-like n=1 Tax=Physella acuta TaxID=109671 RepID=UPI0027DE202C|nr:ankyrin repeat and SAM domain-containing protein 3-like [Physella acuta]XP_059154284.1 ankyrin repeat and SAM domain-containing protein 3-like [Physella acuta]XP_059154285.1 ankyrin repeat and SAM domain-containing protein 3-like [Physella acuta]XP_059154286.1 ankyrin repeat and SAM domain-containing protein 3-like [Physella acuta]
MSSELSYEASDEASENELLERSLSVWRGWSAIEWEDFTPIALDIHTACSIGHFDWVRSLILKNDGQKDRKNVGGWTPLMYACYIGHDNIVNLLIKEGCNMNMKNPKGHTPLMLAASCGNESVARTLVRKGAELELIDRSGWTALFHATYAGHQNFVAFLLEAGANMDAVEPSSGMTPFMEAAAEGHEIIVQEFLKHGVNVNARAHSGDTARTLAVLNGYMKIVSLIDNHTMPLISLRSEAGLELYSSSDEALNKRHPSTRHLRLKTQGPSIRDGPEAIARMIDRTRCTDPVYYPNCHIPKGYVSFPAMGDDKQETKLSHRDVTSPINPEDYKESSESRDYDDCNDDSNAFTKTGAITIKSSSSSSGGLVAALGLSREGSIDSDDSHYQTTSSSDDVAPDGPAKSRNHHRSLKAQERSSNPVKLLKFPDQNLNTEHTGAVSPLCDYFPLDASFPVGTSNPVTNTTGSENNVIPSQPPNSCQSLPKQNMTQAEIVHRYLKNLTLDNPEKQNQFYGYENLWASDSADVVVALKDGSQATESVSNSHKPLKGETDKSSCVNSLSALPLEKSEDKQAQGPTQQEHTPPTAGSKKYPTQSSAVSSSSDTPSVHLNHLLKDTTAVHNQQRTHHPQLNHHHPLYNRHVTYSNHQDIPRPNHPRPNTIQPLTFGPPGTNNTPWQYFYSETEPHGQFGFPTPENLTLPPDYSSQLAAAGALTSNTAHLHGNTSTNNTAGNHFPANSLSQLNQENMFSPSPAMVVIPGHSTSQPVSSTIHWPDEAGVSRSGPRNLAEMLNQLGLLKYLDKFEEQDVDLQVFLSLTDNDLKEIGIKLFGPRKKMTNAIARWHSNAPIASSSLEQAYADRLEGEMQEMAIQLNQVAENEETLKAQILQEQQLRSVTEGCLMEERANWEQARQLLQDTRTKLRTMGDLMSRLRHHQKELRKQLENVSGPKVPEDHSELPEKKISNGGSCPADPSADPTQASQAEEPSKTSSVHTSKEVLKKSEKCLKEMQHTLSSLVQSADRILISTHSLSSFDKDL